ncbi:MAG: IPT/TIG domain-containing protein [Bacteroidota bacterium]
MKKLLAALAFLCCVLTTSYSQVPTITSFSPTTGTIGTLVTITGSGFSTIAANNQVYFGSEKATISSASATSLLVTVPNGTTYQPITVLTKGFTAFSPKLFNSIFVGCDTLMGNSFVASSLLQASTSPRSPVVYDINDDGISDVGVVNRGANNAFFYLSSAQGFDTEARQLITGATPVNIAVHDMDGDGKREIAIGTQGNGLSLFRNVSYNGSFDFEPKVDFPIFGFIASNDIDGDGKPDIAACLGSNSTIRIARNTTNNNLFSFAYSSITSGGIPSELCLADLDGDGKPELIAANISTSTVSIFRNTSTPGAISFASKVDFPTISSPSNIKPGDIDRDGKTDLVFTSGGLSILRNTSTAGNINFATKVDFNIFGALLAAISDLDGDGKPDFALGVLDGTYQLKIAKNTSIPGSISVGNIFQIGIGDGEIACGEITGDDKPDVLIVSGSNIRTYKNQSNKATISSFSPSSGGPGTVVTIRGLNFSSTNQVVIASAVAASYTVVNSTTLTAVVGAGQALPGSGVSITNVEGSAFLAGFTFIPAPIISSVSVSSATTGGGVTIDGNYFTGATEVKFGGTAASSFTVKSATSISAIVGTGSSGNVSVKTPGGTANYAGFTFLNSPVITSFSPVAGVSGTTVTISGSDFTTVSVVKFGGFAASSFKLINDNSITAVVGTGNSGNVYVETSAGAAFLGTFKYTGITSFSPTSALPGTAISITGTNFLGATAVSFGGVAAKSFTVNSATSLSAVVGNGASGAVSVTTPAGSTSKAGFVYIVPAPVITSFSPTTAAFNQQVTISGSNFTGATAVSFGGIPASSFTIVNGNTITASPANGASGDVSITTPGGTTSKTGFTFIPAPTITSFTPQSGVIGTNVTISGTNFVGITAVSFGGTPATSVTLVNSSTITAIVSSGTSGSVQVNAAGGIATKAGFTYSGATINSFSPVSGTTGTLLTINGTNLTGATEIRIGGRLVTSYTVVSASKITAVVGSGASGEVTITTPSGVVSKSGFIFLATPDITSFAPSSAGKGTLVTISGSNFTGATSVQFGGIAAASFTVVSPTKITAVVNTAKSGSIEVMTANGTAMLAGFGYELNLCIGGSTVINAPFTGVSYQWQVNNGTGFINVVNSANYAGATTSILQLNNIPGLWNGYEYRCIISGKASSSTRLHIVNNWTGTISNAWENAQNWSCGILPDSTTDVIIPVKASVVVNSDVLVKSMHIDSAAVIKVNPSKKLRIAGSSNNIKISKASIAENSYLLYGNTPGYVLLPGEKVTYIIKKLSMLAADSIPAGINFTSTNSAIATVTQGGLITAIKNGETSVIATDANGKKIEALVTVMTSDIPLITDPLFAAFSRPFYTINSTIGEKLKVDVLNRLGNRVSATTKIVAKNSDGEQEFASETSIKLKEAAYELSVKANGIALNGDAVLFSFDMENSQVLESTPATDKGVNQNAFLTPPKGLPYVYYVSLDSRTVPVYFNRPGLTSRTIHGNVFYLAAYKVYAGEFWTGVYELTTIITDEDINVEVKSGTVLGGGKQLTSLGGGQDSWRINHLNFIGSWKMSSVFFDFTGDWICKNDGYGRSIKMRVPRVDDFIYYSPQLNTPYKSFKLAATPGHAQMADAVGEFTDLATGVVVSKGPVQIGPWDVCSCLEGTSNPYKPGRSTGGMLHEFNNRNGAITYFDEQEFHYSSRLPADSGVPYYRSETIYIRKAFNYSPVITSFSPMSAQQGTVITINGSSFLGATSVTFGGVAASSFTVVSDTKITAVVGSGASGEIRVTTPIGIGGLAGFYMPVPPPLITTFDPITGAPKTMVTIVGSNFVDVTSVSIGGADVNNWTIINNETIVAEVPFGATSGDVKVITNTGTATKSGFTFMPYPVDLFNINTGIEEIELLGGRLTKNFPQNQWSLETQRYSDTRISIYGPTGEVAPAVGTYNFSQLTISYYQKEGDKTVLYGNPASGTIKFTIINSRCIGTISNYKIFAKLFIGYSTTQSVTINGTFDVPVY